MSNILQVTIRSLSFAFWSLRGRVGQAIPVGLAFLLLIGAVQIIGSLHDVSSSLARQQIARSWRDSYDLFVRPQSAVSQVERATGWVDPQYLLDSYGGISDAQVAAIRSLPHVAQVMPFATVGWQGMAIIAPISLSHIGTYRITAYWQGQQQQNTSIVFYVSVTDLHGLLSEPTITNPVVQPLLMADPATSVTFQAVIPAVQAIIGISTTQQSIFRSVLLQNAQPVSSVHLSLSLQQLNGPLSNLPACIADSACWQPQRVQSGPFRYQTGGVQLLRYSQTRYFATPAQIAAGQLSPGIIGSDAQGPLYRTLLPEHLTLPDTISTTISQASLASSNGLLPLTAPQHMPLVPTAIRFIPLAQACLVNGTSCYSGLYIRLNGAATYSQQSLSLLQATAAAITARTGLHVDILDGSSTRTVSMILPSNSPVATITSTWRVVGVAVQIIHGVDALQETLLVLCSCVCLLAIGASAMLIGLGRKKDMLLLLQVGWPRPLIAIILFLDAFMLCLPGFLLSAVGFVVASVLFPTTLPAILLWSLLIAGVIIYCIVLTTTASSSQLPASSPRRNSFSASVIPPSPAAQTPAKNGEQAKAMSLLLKLQAVRHSNAFAARVTAPFICAISITCAVFLIVEEYLLVTNLNQVLIVTILGTQVREALEGPQLALLLVVIGAALLTTALCTSLLLRGRRFEFSMLAMVGWERKFVLLRMLWAGWWPALLSGEVGALLALFAIAFFAAVPAAWAIIGVVICGPLVGAALASMVTIVLAWQETERVFAWKT